MSTLIDSSMKVHPWHLNRAFIYTFFYHLTFLFFYLQLKEELCVSGSEEEADDPLCMESDEDLSDEVDKEIHDEVRIGG